MLQALVLALAQSQVEVNSRQKWVSPSAFATRCSLQQTMATLASLGKPMKPEASIACRKSRTNVPRMTSSHLDTKCNRKVCAQRGHNDVAQIAVSRSIDGHPCQLVRTASPPESAAAALILQACVRLALSTDRLG
jgi:hypothetical protein